MLIIRPDNIKHKLDNNQPFLTQLLYVIITVLMQDEDGEDGRKVVTAHQIPGGANMA